MVQQLSLWASLSVSEQSVALETLEAVTGMGPREFTHEICIWEPTNEFHPHTGHGQVNQIEQYRIFSIRSAENDPWVLEVQEVPETGRTLKVISQSVLRTKLVQGDLKIFLNDIGYSFTSKFKIRGLEFVSKRGVTFHLFRLYDDETDNLLDESGQWVVKAFFDVTSVTDLPAIEVATAELETAQQDLRGILSLVVPSRASFNTRYRRV